MERNGLLLTVAIVVKIGVSPVHTFQRGDIQRGDTGTVGRALPCSIAVVIMMGYTILDITS